MPIYAYSCSACGHTEDVMQKITDSPLSTCPKCGEASLAKQVTAAGFMLKGTGWYVTDFKGGNKPSDNGTAKKEDASAHACGLGGSCACS